VTVAQNRYAFEGLPVSAVDAGTNSLVTGPALGGIRDLVMRLLLRQHSREGVLFIAADTNGPEALRTYESLGGDLDRARVGVVDCTEESVDDAAHNIHAVGSPSDLTGVGIAFSSLYQSLHDNGAGQVRTGVYTLSPFVLYASVKPVYRFLHTLTGRIRSADGLGVCAIDPDTVDTQTLSSLAQAFDGRVELRNEDGETALRVRGLADQPDGWQALEFSTDRL
jgi:hypothetical protein